MPKSAMIIQRALILMLSIFIVGCAVNPKQLREAARVVDESQSKMVTCKRADRCATPSPLLALALNPLLPKQHHVGLLNHNEDSLVLRIHLIRSAQKSIDLQTFIFSHDDAGKLVLGELLLAAERGVKVRVLADQLFSIDSATVLAGIARHHVNFEFRVYNPTFGEASTAPLEFAAGIVCCFKRFNQRMHNKLLLIDGEIGINGGRNIDDRYFNWSATFNYQDRDVLVIGPATGAMRESFNTYWRHQQTVPVLKLADVSRKLAEQGSIAEKFRIEPFVQSERIANVRARASSDDFIREEFVDKLFQVEHVEYFSDLPNKPFESHPDYDRDMTDRLIGLLANAKSQVSLQTPYLVFSKRAQKILRRLAEKKPQVEVEVSTNSLAATDAFYVYAISHKYKRRYLTHLNLKIYEYRPWPKSVSSDTAAKKKIHQQANPAVRDGYGRLKRKRPVPLISPEIVRRGLHAKSMVVDEKISMIGTHNFDPRSDYLNTESGVVIWDAAFAKSLTQSIRADMMPEQAWVIARKPELPWVGKINDMISRFSEQLPLFDFWPFRYTTNFELKPGCEPLPIDHVDFYQCYEAVGDFPEVDSSSKRIYTLMVTAFGAGLMPIL